MNPIFINPTNNKLFLPKIMNINNEFVKLIKEIRNPKTFEAPDDFILEIKRWTLRNILGIALDGDFGIKRDDSKVLQLLKDISKTTELSFELDVIPPVWKFVSTPNSKAMISVLDNIQTTLEDIVDEAINNMDMTKKKEEQYVLQKLVSIDRKLATVMVMDMLSTGLETVDD